METSTKQVFVVPGDLVLRDDEINLIKKNVTVKVGNGLIKGDETIYAAKAGKVWNQNNINIWLDCRQKWYQPLLDEPVIGRVISKHADSFRIDIGSAHIATLLPHGSEKTAKKNRLVLEVGDLVYACVSLADRDVEPEIQCADRSGGQNNVEYGTLKNGFLIRCSLDISR